MKTAKEVLGLEACATFKVDPDAKCEITHSDVNTRFSGATVSYIDGKWYLVSPNEGVWVSPTANGEYKLVESWEKK